MVLLVFCAVVPALAQTGTLPLLPPPNVEATTYELQAAATQQAHQAELRRIIDIRRAVTRYHIAYFADDVSDASQIAGEMSKWLPTLELITSMNGLEFAASPDRGQFDVAVIDVSALSWLDVDWLRAQYAAGMPVLTIGMTYNEHREVTGDQCNVPRGGKPIGRSQALDQNAPNFSVIISSIDLRYKSRFTPETWAGFVEAALRTCDDMNVLTGYSASYATLDIFKVEDFQRFTVGLVGIAQSYEFRRNREILDHLISERLAAEGLEE
jgi:hypothetical protein